MPPVALAVGGAGLEAVHLKRCILQKLNPLWVSQAPVSHKMAWLLMFLVLAAAWAYQALCLPAPWRAAPAPGARPVGPERRPADARPWVLLRDR